MSMQELESLSWDQADFLRVAGAAGCIAAWPVLWAAWQRIPRQDRERLRGRFTLRLVGGVGARVGVPVASAAVGRPEIVLGVDAPDFMLSWIHELAHIFCGHLNGAAVGPARIFGQEIGAAGVDVLLAAGGWRPVVLSEAEAEKEKQAWEQCARWGFDVRRYLDGGSSKP